MQANRREKDKGDSFNRGGKNKRLKSKIKSVQKNFFFSGSLDIDQHNSTLRQRARMLYMAAPIATSAIRTNRTNVIGCGLKLKSRINRQILGLTQEQADAWEKKAEAEFELWASRKQACVELVILHKSSNLSYR